MNNYFFSKISNINRRMALHEGDANRRLAYQANDILAQLHITAVPEKYKKEFIKFISLISETVTDAGGRTPIRIKGIQNRTAVKYIKLLTEIQEHLEFQPTMEISSR